MNFVAPQAPVIDRGSALARTARSLKGRRSLLAFGAALTLLGSTAAVAKAPGHALKFTGTTSESATITFTLEPGGRSLKALKTAIGYNGKCGQGGGPAYAIDTGSIAVSASGSFSARTLGRLPNAAVKVKPQKFTVSGKVKGRSAHGKISEIGNLCSNGQFKGVNPYSETFTARAH